MPSGRVAELVDVLGLGSSGETRGGSTPPMPTTFYPEQIILAEKS